MREMIGVALPMVVSFACDTVMIFTDRLLLARLGPDLMNAALGGGIGFYMLITFMLGLTGYTTALSAQYLGAGQKENCAKVLVQAFLLILAAWPIILCFRGPIGLLFKSMGVPEAQLGPQIEYFEILALGCVAMIFRHAMASFFSGIGNTRVVMAASLMAMVINVFSSYTLIFGKFGFPAMGIAGAAVGTLFASFCACLVLLGVLFSKKIREEYRVIQAFVFNPEIMKKLLRYGYPSGIEMFLAVAAFNFMVMTFHSTGPVNATAASIMLNWDMVTFVPLLGIEIGVTSLVGRYMGAGRPDIAHKSVMSGVKMGSIYSMLMFVLFMFFPYQLVTVFHPEVADPVFNQSIAPAVFMLRIVCLYLVSEIIVIVFVGALRGAGDTLWAMCFSVGLHWFIAAALFIMLKVFNLSICAGWAIAIVLFLALSGIVLLRYHEGKWKSLRIIQPE